MKDLLVADLLRIVWRPLARASGVVMIIAIMVAGVVVFVRSGGNHSFNPLTGVRTAMQDAAIPLALVGFVLGASLLGADYTSRALTTLCTWEPRRHRVLATRATACAAVTACLSLAALLLLTVALVPAALAHSTGDAPTATWYFSTVGLAVRCALLAAAVSVIGVACAAIGRSTVAAFISIAVYWLVVQQAALGLLPSIRRWLFVANAQSWVLATHHPSIGSPDASGAAHTVTTAGLLLLAIVLVLHVFATWTVRRRDLS